MKIFEDFRGLKYLCGDVAWIDNLVEKERDYFLEDYFGRAE